MLTAMVKYDSQRKQSRNQLLVDYHKANPDISLREIGRDFKITPQRVWEIIQIYKKKDGGSNA